MFRTSSRSEHAWPALIQPLLRQAATWGTAPFCGLEWFRPATGQCRQVVFTAKTRQCADEFGDQEFDSCHLLSGLYREGNGVAFHVLKGSSVTQRRIDDTLRSRHRLKTVEFQINTEMKDVLDTAFAAAREMSHNYIGTEHLLIGAMSETTCSAKMLMDFGIAPHDVKNEVYNLLGYSQSQRTNRRAEG